MVTGSRRRLLASAVALLTTVSVAPFAHGAVAPWTSAEAGVVRMSGETPVFRSADGVFTLGLRTRLATVDLRAVHVARPLVVSLANLQALRRGSTSLRLVVSARAGGRLIARRVLAASRGRVRFRLPAGRLYELRLDGGRYAAAPGAAAPALSLDLS